MPRAKPVTRATSNRRLLKLANFLSALPRRSFDFSKWVAETEKRNGTHCGTTCCAVGWMPRVDARNWRWEKRSTLGFQPALCTGSKQWPTDDAAKYFGISLTEASYLFVPDDTSYSEGNLPDTAPPKRVAQHIRRFVARRTKHGTSGLPRTNSNHPDYTPKSDPWF